MIRNLLSRLRMGAFCVGACLSLIASQSWALGLGEIELDSALNEKLNAEIELLDASGLQPSEIMVSLASNEDFQRIGVERFFFLTDLRFEVTYGAGGKATVAVSSSQPITEPYLNFLVEVLWPNGRLLKEYTVLLDPPTFSQAAAPAVSAPRQSEAPSQTAGRVERPATARSGTQVQMAPTSEASQARSPLDDSNDSELMTDRQDTLWAIASRTRPSRAITVQQNMLAIQRLNPEAFINDNINLLKAGYVLRLPSESQARSLSAGEAVATVASQNEAWRAYSRGETPASRATSQGRVAASSGSELQGQVDATASGAAARSSATGAGGELRIVAGTGDSATGTANEAVAGELNAAREEQDRLGREVDELTYQLDREQELAKNQLDVKDRQLEVKDQQIAEKPKHFSARAKRALVAVPLRVGRRCGCFGIGSGRRSDRRAPQPRNRR
jgi:pilus assembly protein FimV